MGAVPAGGRPAPAPTPAKDLYRFAVGRAPLSVVTSARHLPPGATNEVTGKSSPVTAVGLAWVKLLTT